MGLAKQPIVDGKWPNNRKNMRNKDFMMTLVGKK
jgi:hypothetical protein